MKRPLLALLLCLTGVAALGMPAFAALKPGDAAPTFTVEAAQGGKVFTFDLASALKTGPVVVYFYPKSFTSVCTVEAHDFADAIPDFKAAGATVIGLSGDGIDVQREFSSKECRDTFPVGADPGFKIIKAYDAAFTIPGTSMGFANRISYVIAPDGKILSAYSDSEAADHIKNALTAVRAWRAAQAR